MKSGRSATTAELGCGERFVWPIQPKGSQVPRIIQPFKNPEKPWLKGHRGVDLQTYVGQEIYSPHDGIIHFVGSVGGKDVVSIEYKNGWISTFEPAKTILKEGDVVARNQIIGRVEGVSDHCVGTCVQWGVRIAD